MLKLIFWEISKKKNSRTIKKLNININLNLWNYIGHQRGFFDDENFI